MMRLFFCSLLNNLL